VDRDNLDAFGRFIVANLRDKSLEQFEMLRSGQLRGLQMKDVQRHFAELSEDQRQLVKEIVVDVIDTALHDLLFALQDAHDREGTIEICINGVNVAKLSGMLHGEIQGTDGWIARFSRFPPQQQRGV